jgi:hypothetical protein
MASDIIVVITANFIPNSCDFRELKTGPNLNASFRASFKIIILYLLFIR